MFTRDDANRKAYMWPAVS